MHRIFIALILIPILSLSAFSQDEAKKEKTECPKIEIISPPSAVHPGDTMKFTVSFDEQLKVSDLELKWSVDRGKIIEGQGTKEISVSTEGLRDTTINAQLEVVGLPKSCASKFTDAGIVAGITCGSPLDEFGSLENDDVRARLDNLFISLQNYPKAMGHIINFGSNKEILKRKKLIKNHIKFRKFDGKRIIYINGGKEEQIRTKIWIVPAGADTSCIY